MIDVRFSKLLINGNSEEFAKANTTYNPNEKEWKMQLIKNIFESIINQQDIALRLIEKMREELVPEDVFTDKQLKQWALESGYVLKAEAYKESVLQEEETHF